MDDDGGLTPGLLTTLEIAGVLVVAWGMLLLLTLGFSLTGIGSAMVCAAQGVAIIQANRRAVVLGWIMTALMTMAVLADPSSAVLVLVWCCFFTVSMFLTDNRGRLRARRAARDSVRDARGDVGVAKAELSCGQ